MSKRMKWFDHLAYFLLVLGAFNWGIFGFSRFIGKPFDLVSWMPMWLANSVFVIVGLAGLFAIYTWIKLVMKD